MKKRIRGFIFLVGDIVIINMVYLLAFFIRFDNQIFSEMGSQFVQLYLEHALQITLIKIGIFYFFNMYKNLWRYASILELVQIISSSIIANSLATVYFLVGTTGLPRSIYVLTFILDVFFIGGLRLSFRILSNLRSKRHVTNNKEVKRVMIIGGGHAGAQVIKELFYYDNLSYNPVAIIDDNELKQGNNINGVPVLGNRTKIVSIAEELEIDEIIIAIPSSSKKNIKEIVKECSKTKCDLKILPGLYEIIDGQVSINQIRDVEIEDLLGRDPIEVNLEEISDYLNNKTVLVTGGGGSIGSELCRQIARFRPRKLLIIDIYENSVYDIQGELRRKYPDLNFELIIASIRDSKRINELFEFYRPEVVFHAAAHKHVPLMEANPKEAIKNNVFGTYNVAECAHKYGVARFVLISTDKAVNPTNIMGATKRVAEMIVQSFSSVSNTEFVAVRFGNVLGSNGSVIPLFKKQIKLGGPITITHSEVTRYFMTIPEAVQLVIQAGSMAKGGEIFVLDMGEPVKIIDLANNLIRLSGLQPGVDIDIKIVGLRPGEKLYEELLMDEEGLENTKHEKIFVGQPIFTDLKLLNRELDILREFLDSTDQEIKEYLASMVPTYTYEKQEVQYINKSNIVNLQQ